MASRLRRGGDQPKGGRGNVARNCEVARFRHLIAENADRVVLAFGGTNEKVIEHELGVISACEPLLHRRFSFGEKAGKQDRALDLGARDWGTILNSPQRSAADSDRWSLLRTFSDNIGAHFSERFDHAIHRATGGRRGSAKSRFECLAGE